ncbi:hypothetical protein CCC_03611 [Paramagnetospirillum magnetotacticum MS-1]|uniref:Uncharacterized protein n=1 Tax=Paramagnetospirillum magnetotacticum MS-1 TaxID=272627 RepID=A0A0C2YT53_PARME|nr:hypothetical protein [Paramagnetospirillum magnetotacticum]KIL98328.1 hypothetical protein CCC_03611 [Paramagnetospirillum magnetotacticum MS-1]
MGQKAARREKLAAIRDRVWAIIAAPEVHSLMSRERALDSLGYLWEIEKDGGSALLVL